MQIFTFSIEMLNKKSASNFSLLLYVCLIIIYKQLGT